MIKHTRWHYYTEGGERYRIDAEYGIDYDAARRYIQEPNFIVTGAIERKARNNRWYDHSGGQVTRELTAYVPEIAPYLKWHLVGPDGPMYYFANGKYWFEVAQGKAQQGKFPTDPIKAFTHTIAFGAFPGDEAPPELRQDLEHAVWREPGESKWKGPKEWAPGVGTPRYFRDARWPDVEAWLQERLPKLQAAWVVDMGELGVLE